MDQATIDLRIRLANLTVDVSAAALTTVWPDWRDDDYVPDYNKFYFILGGGGTLEIDGKAFAPRAGQLYLMPAGVRQSYRTDPARPFTKYWCHFTARLGEQNLFDLVRPAACVTVPDGPALEAAFRELVGGFGENGLVAALRCKAALTGIIARYLEWCGGDLELPGPAADSRFQWVMSHIEENLARHISVDELAAIACLQKNYFIGQFRQIFGVPPIRYLLLRRIGLAKDLLARSEASVSEIASRTGFGDVFHFSRSFKEHTGFSPSAWRMLGGTGKTV